MRDQPATPATVDPKPTADPRLMRATPAVIGMAVRHGRKHANLTQAQLAATLRVSRKWLSELENGKIDSNLLRALHALELSGFNLLIQQQPFDPAENTGRATPNA